MKVTWKYTIPLVDDSTIELAELKYRFRLPEDLKECIAKNNAGTPSPSTFDLGNKKHMVFGGLLSFNEKDTDNVYEYLPLFVSENGANAKMFPFALDPAGNFFCVMNNAIVLYDHETDSTVEVCKSFTELLEKLY